MSGNQSNQGLLQLYPVEAQAQAGLHGLYLKLNLHRLALDGDVLIYANYISSLDGRISLYNDTSNEFEVPLSIANRRDWRMYQELAAQSDVMITSARYFRQLAKGRAQDLLPVGMEPEYADLLGWRMEQGLKAQPDVVIVSNSLDIPCSALEKLQERKVSVLTGCRASAEKIATLESYGVGVTVLNTETVTGVALKAWLVESVYRSAYMIAGPEVHRTLVHDNVLNRLFLTTHMTLLGENKFHTILSGGLNDAVKLSLITLYLDQGESDSQFFAQYALQAV